MTEFVFDPVHTVQAAFRKILSAWSFPGRLFELEPEARTLPEDLGLPAILVLAGRLLLDTETPFCVRGQGAEQAQDLLSRLCYAPAKPSTEATFVFCAEAGKALEQVFQEAKLGTLENPHEGATILALVPDLDAGVSCRWEGPGIQTSRTQNVPLDEGLIALRNQANREFPLGFDLMLFDHRQRVMVLPRTTRLVFQEETPWRM